MTAFLCDAGTFSDSEGSSHCRICDEGKCSTLGASVCLDCQPGFFTVHLRVKPHACVICGAGTFSNTVNVMSCYNCSTGRFAMNNGNSECQPFSTVLCNAGNFYTHGSAVLDSICNFCAPGEFQPQNEVTVSKCSSCNVGYFQSSRSSSKCVACSNGMYQNATG